MAASQPANFNLQEFTDAGQLLVGGRLYTYAYGTTAQKIAYTDPAGTVPHTYTSDGAGGQYIALNVRGELPAPLYLAAGSYDIALKRADGSTVWTRKADGIDNGTNTLTAALFDAPGASLVGFSQAGASKRTVQGKLRESVSILDFIPESEHAAILDRTSTYDCADAIEAAQEFLSPFPWAGSVAATKAGIAGAMSKLRFPGGLYVIKRPVKLNPYVEFSGPFSAFFFAKSGAEIRADFDGRDLAALDTAPWTSAGVRTLGKMWISGDFDGGTITGSMGQRMSNMRITCAAGRNIKAGINATGAAPFFIDGSTIDGFNVGVIVSCSWSGHIRGSFIKARAIGVWTAEGVNQFKSWGNYLGPTGVKPSTADFDWPTTPVAGYDQATRAFYMNQGYITSDSDTMESWDVGLMTTICAVFRSVNSYMEAIALGCYVLHDTQAYIQPSKINCPAAKLYDVIGKGRIKEVEFVLTALRSGSFRVGSLGTTSTCGVSLTGSPDVTPFQPAGVLVPEFDYPNTLTIYLDRTNGNDLYAGYHPNYPVKELMTALSRCRKGCVNVISVSGDVVTNTVGGNDWATFFSDLNIRFVKTSAASTIYLKYDATTSRMIPLPFENCKVDFNGFQLLDDVPATVVAAGYGAAFNLSGINEIRLNGCTIRTAKPMFQASRFSAALLNLFIKTSTLRSYDGVTNTNFIETDTAYSGKLVWTEIGYQVTKTAVVVGSNVNNTKIASTDF